MTKYGVTMSKYLLDTNCFIEAKNRFYGFDFCPGYWDWLMQSKKSGLIFSIKQVKDELNVGKDDLADWAKDNSDLFLEIEEDESNSLKEISKWVNNVGYKASVVDDFLRKADFFLCAYAKSRNLILVTLEIDRTSMKKVPIPNVCNAFKIQYITPYEMLRREKARFIYNQADDNIIEI